MERVGGRKYGASLMASTQSRSMSRCPLDFGPHIAPTLSAAPLKYSAALSAVMVRFCHPSMTGFFFLAGIGTGIIPRRMTSRAVASGLSAPPPPPNGLESFWHERPTFFVLRMDGPAGFEGVYRGVPRGYDDSRRSYPRFPQFADGGPIRDRPLAPLKASGRFHV